MLPDNYEPFAALWAEYEAKAVEVARQQLEEHVWPLFKKRGYKMLSGNGTFYIKTRKGNYVEKDACKVRKKGKDPALADALFVLHTPVPGVLGSIGTWGFDYPPPGTRRRVAGADE